MRIRVANRASVSKPAIKKCLNALPPGDDYLQAHSEESWLALAKRHPELSTDRRGGKRCRCMPVTRHDWSTSANRRTFNNRLIKKITPVNDYVVEIE